MISPESVEKILTENMLHRAIIEADTATAKCRMYAALADSSEIKTFFLEEAKVLQKSQEKFMAALEKL